jgi:[protein-PII] uridylyltransferase
VASRRDLSDPVTIERVAEAVGTMERLHLLAALTEADSLATGPSAWSPWKAGLIATLVERAERVLTKDGSAGALGGTVAAGGAIGAAGAAGFPTPAQLARLAEAGRQLEARGDILTVITDDRPGVFSRVAGVLALHGLDVVTALAHSTDDGRALAEFRVIDAIRAAVPWPRVIADLDLALDGRLALSARLAERRRTYDRGRPAYRNPTPTAVSFDNAASDGATVIDVRMADGIGLLYRITRALAELDLDIRSARVQTLGPDVIDSFYVRDEESKKVTDPDSLREIERAVLHAADDARA